MTGYCAYCCSQACEAGCPTNVSALNPIVDASSPRTSAGKEEALSQEEIDLIPGTLAMQRDIWQKKCQEYILEIHLLKKAMEVCTGSCCWVFEQLSKDGGGKDHLTSNP